MLASLNYSSTTNVNFDLLTYMIGSYHYNWHEQLELIWLLKGQVEANVDGERFLLNPDDLILINPNCGHATFARSSDCIAMRLHIVPAFLTNQGVALDHGAFQLNSVTVPQHQDYPLIRKILAQLQLAETQKQSTFEINALYYRLISLLLQDFFNPEVTINTPLKRRQGSLNRVIQYLNHTYDQAVTLDRAAAISHYSSAYLSRVFKSELGINFYEYLTRCRLQHAVYDLEDRTMKIADVAFKNGFKEVKSFNLMFKKHFGQTPSNYREHLQLESRPQKDQFKQPLNATQTNWVIAQLQQVITTTTNAPLSACEHCVYKRQFSDYQALKVKVGQLKKVLNQ